MTTPGTTVTCVLDYLEHRLWGAQDLRLTAAGWEVTRIGRWRRRYRYAGKKATGPAPTRCAPVATASNSPRPAPTGKPATVAASNSPGAAQASTPSADRPGAGAPDLAELFFGWPAATARSGRLVFVSASGQLADSPPYLPRPVAGRIAAAWPLAGTKPADQAPPTAPAASSLWPAADRIAATSTPHAEPDAVDRLVTGLVATCRGIAGYFARSS